jgi:hypothetical protein
MRSEIRRATVTGSDLSYCRITDALPELLDDMPAGLPRRDSPRTQRSAGPLAG